MKYLPTKMEKDFTCECFNAIKYTGIWGDYALIDVALIEITL